MWHSGIIGVPQVKGPAIKVQYSVKVYDRGSEFGINGGRISKLYMSDCRTGDVLANYDRGWDIEPVNEAAEFALAILLESYKEYKHPLD